MTDRSIVIVGAGIAGVTTAEALRDGGHRGPITLVSDERDVPYDRPPLSKDVLAGTAQVDAGLRTADWFAVQRVDLVLGDGAVAIGEAAVTLRSGRALPFDVVVLATGTRARRLAMFDGVAGHYLRTADDARRLQAAIRPGGTLAIVGAGVIGLEVAATAAKLGAQAIVIEAGPRVMARSLSPLGSEIVAEHHRAIGVDIRLGAAIVGVDTTAGGVGIVLAGGETIVADEVVIGIGAEPNTALAEAAGIVVEDGIVVDHAGRTSRAGIFAVGDVARFPCAFHGRAMRVEQWQHAVEQARAVAAAILGGDVQYAHVPWFWSDQGELAIQVVGRTDGDAEVVRVEKRGRVLFHLERGRLVGATSFNQARLRRALAGLVGRGAEVSAEVLADPGTDLKGLAAG